MLNETSRLVRSQPIEARRTALIVIDVQNWVFDAEARVANAYFQHRLHELVLPKMGIPFTDLYDLVRPSSADDRVIWRRSDSDRLLGEPVEEQSAGL